MKTPKPPLALFARVPEAGKSKTRLAPALGEEGAATLYAAFLEDAVRFALAVPQLEPSLWAASEAEREILAERFPKIPTRTQCEGSIGERMQAALADGIAQAGRAFVIGTDSPTLPPRLLREANAALEEADVVFVPAADGGFVLIGARGDAPRLDAEIRWSTPHALEDTEASLIAAGRRVARTSPWYDVDTPEDLRLLETHLTLRPRTAPATATALGIAVPSEVAVRVPGT